jgi:RecA/RadA recombinase
MSLPFLKDFKRTLEKLENVTTDFRPPSHWYSTGNYAANKILSGDYRRGVPQGRISILAGPSGSGKSFLLSNIMCAAQADGAYIIALDSENALDHDYLGKIGVSTTEDKFLGISVVTISDVVSVVSDFIKKYEKEYGKFNENAPKVFIALDSIDMLLTETENSNFNAGEQKGDQGQRAKQMKHFLRTVVSRIKSLNISFVATHQVYPADPLKGEGQWAINNAVRYSASQIALITRLKLKEEGEVSGIRMYIETFKSRFAKLGSKVEIMVPYETGMNQYSGLLELMMMEGIVSQGGAWYTLHLPEGDRKFQRKEIGPELVSQMFNHPKILGDQERFESVIAIPDTIDESGFDRIEGGEVIV